MKKYSGLIPLTIVLSLAIAYALIISFSPVVRAQRSCDANAVGDNVMVGCIWDSTHTVADTYDVMVGPARHNDPLGIALEGPPRRPYYRALGPWGLSYHHYGCCNKWPGLSPCFSNSCELVGSNPLAVEGVAGYDYQDAIQYAGGKWQGDFDFKKGTYIFVLGSDDGSKAYLDGQILIDNGGLHADQSKFVERTFMEAGRHRLRVEYYNACCDASLFFEFAQFIPTITITPTSASTTVGQTAQFTAALDPDGNFDDRSYPHYVHKTVQNVTATAEWVSENPGIAIQTSQKGQYRGLQAGRAKIWARLNPGTSNEVGGFAWLDVTGTSSPPPPGPTPPGTPPPAPPPAGTCPQPPTGTCPQGQCWTGHMDTTKTPAVPLCAVPGGTGHFSVHDADALHQDTTGGAILAAAESIARIHYGDDASGGGANLAPPTCAVPKIPDDIPRCVREHFGTNVLPQPAGLTVGDQTGYESTPQGVRPYYLRYGDGRPLPPGTESTPHKGVGFSRADNPLYLHCSNLDITPRFPPIWRLIAADQNGDYQWWDWYIKSVYPPSDEVQDAFDRCVEVERDSCRAYDNSQQCAQTAGCKVQNIAVGYSICVKQ